MLANVGLYLMDSYARQFEARVLDVKGNCVALDRTAFCPGEGGQKPDRGWLRWGGGTSNVANVAADSGVFWHQVEGSRPPVGTTITGELDWAYRHKMMRTHTAYHLTSAIMFHLCGAQTLKAQVLATGFRINFKTDCWCDALAHDLEFRVNQAITADVPVLTYLLSRQEARETPFLNSLKVDLLPAWVKNVRVAEIEGIALDVDTGTHVRSSREIGGMQIARHTSLANGYEQIDLRLLAKAPVKNAWPSLMRHVDGRHHDGYVI